MLGNIKLNNCLETIRADRKVFQGLDNQGRVVFIENKNKAKQDILKLYSAHVIELFNGFRVNVEFNRFFGESSAVLDNDCPHGNLKCRITTEPHKYPYNITVKLSFTGNAGFVNTTLSIEKNPDVQTLGESIGTPDDDYAIVRLQSREAYNAVDMKDWIVTNIASFIVDYNSIIKDLKS